MSNGIGISKDVIDRKVRKAKAQVLEDQKTEYGYNFCQQCARSSGTRFDCAHTFSVDKCQKERMVEVAWSPKNIRILCRECHKKQDGLDLKFNKIK